MGIISDFLNTKQAIEENRTKSKTLGNFIYSLNKKRLNQIKDTLILANEPLSKDEILELAQSIHGISVGSNYEFIDGKAKVDYFPGNESYRLTLLLDTFKDDEIQLFEITVSSKNKEMETLIQIKESEDVIRTHRLSMSTIHTNIKELKGYINICNHELYLLIHCYLSDVLAEMR